MDNVEESSELVFPPLTEERTREIAEGLQRDLPELERKIKQIEDNMKVPRSVLEQEFTV